MAHPREYRQRLVECPPRSSFNIITDADPLKERIQYPKPPPQEQFPTLNLPSHIERYCCACGSGELKCPLRPVSFVACQREAIWPPEIQQGSNTMRVMVIVKATKNSEAGMMPGEKLLADMGKYNEELVNAGIMQAGEGLHPSSKGKRVRFADGKKTVIDGPFAATNELIAGFWMWQVKSMDEAVEWVRRCPDPMPGEESEIEIRPVFEAEDFGEEFTPELRAQEDRLREELERRQNG